MRAAGCGGCNDTTFNIGVITQGKLCLTVDGSTTHYGVGEWYHVAANVEHSAYFDADTSEIERWFKVDRLTAVQFRDAFQTNIVNIPIATFAFFWLH